MAESSKDTVYIDVDDDITTIIDKVRASGSKLVALVLPKRASVLQSIVNMKLLKRTADNEKKNVVLITSESGLMPLAGAVGLHVASTLNSKPAIPSAPSRAGLEPETVNEDMKLDDDEEMPDLTEKAGAAATVGALAAAAEKPIAPPVTGAHEGVETVELEDEEEPDAKSDSVTDSKEEAAAAAAKQDKHLKVPNFDRFRLLIFLGLLLVIALIVLAVFAFKVLPKATIDIKTDASNVNTNLTLTLDTQATSPDTASGDIPAKMVQEQKTFTETVNATGQQNNGSTATGSVTFVDCAADGSPVTIPAGTAITYNNLSYITQSDAYMATSTFNFQQQCKATGASTATVNINAQSPGSTYNTGNNNVSFTVPNYSDVNANGSASGGTDNIVTVVTEADVNTATSKISTDDSSVKQDLSNQLLGQGLYPVNVTFSRGNVQTSANPSVGTASNTVTVTETITYSMYGTAQTNLNAVLKHSILSQTTQNQNIISNGLTQNAFRQVNENGTTDQVSLSTLAVVGPSISVDQIKKEAAGKSPQTIISTVKNNPDVTDVIVKLSPFWVSSAPSNTAKIKVEVAKPSQTV